MNGIDPKRALKRLYDLNVSPEVFKSADTYQCVKRYESSPELAKYAKRVRDKLLGGRKREKGGGEDDADIEHTALKKAKKEEVNLDEEFAEAMKSGVSAQASSAPRATVDYSKYKVVKRVEVKVEPKPEPVDVHEQQASSSSMSYQREHQKDYAPVVPTCKPSGQPKKAIPQSKSLHADENMFKPRKERQKVFAGRRKRVGEGVSTLVSLCQTVLMSHIDMIDHVGIVPFDLLKPVLDHASTDQLRHILDVNPMLVEDADEMFHEMVSREFPKYANREKSGWTWREMYDRLVEKKQKKENDKLEMLTSRIGKSNSAQSQGRQTMVIDMAHTRVRSKSFFNTVKDSQVKMSATPSALQLSQARKNVKIEGKAQLRTITPRGGGVPSTSRSRSNNNNNMNNGLVVKKTAPLMAKCKKMLKR